MTKPATFLRHAGTMMVGTAVSQVIPIAISPLLTRLYEPAEFGVFSAVVAAAAILSVAATLRLDLSIVLPAREDVAADLAFLAICFSGLFCVLVGVGMIVAPHVADRLFGRAGAVGLAIPILTLILAWTQTLGSIVNRERGYRILAMAAVAQQACAGVVAITLGVVGFSGSGLLYGRLSGAGIGLLAVAAGAAGWLKANFRLGSAARLRQAFWQYRQFPLYNVPYSLTGSFSREFVILALTAVHQLSAAGFYGLARSVLTAPISFLSASLSQVFYKEGAVSIGTPAFTRLTLTVLRNIALGFTPFFALGWFWSVDAFNLLFGPQWREAGSYAATLMPVALLSLFTSWPDRVFEIRQKQQISLLIQVTFDFISIAATWLALSHQFPPLSAVRIYVGIQIGYHLVYLYAVFRLGGMTVLDYWQLLGLIALLLAAMTGFQSALVWIPLASWIQFGISFGLASILAGGLLVLAHVNTRRTDALDAAEQQ